MKERLAIFDFDGTIFDTVPANSAAYGEALSAHGFSVDEEYFARYCNGRYYKDFLPPIIGSDEVLLETIHREKTACYPKHLNRIRENRPLFDLLRSLRPFYHTALVSTAARDSVMRVLKLFDRTGDFDLILTQQDIPKKKPAPDGFLMAMAHFGVSAENTVIFEDSEEGIAAAKDSGAAYFIVRDI